MSSFQLNIQELRNPSNVYSLTVRWFTSIKDIKDMLHRITRQPPRVLDLFYGTNARVLGNNLTLHDFGIERAGYVLRLAINNGSSFNNGGGHGPAYVLTPSRDVALDTVCRRMLQDVRGGLDRGVVPMRTDVLDCTGGVYFLKSLEKRKIAVFKPHDEEQGMPNNDKGYGGNGEHSLRPNFKPGQGCIREVAAYIMDVDSFAGVPPTTLVHLEHPAFNYSSALRPGGHTSKFPKLGSLQAFVESESIFEDVGPNLFSDFEIQKLALFDMRSLNCDRNASNILVQRKQRPCSGGMDMDKDYSQQAGGRRDSRSASLSSWDHYYSSDDFFESSRSDDDEDASGSTSRSGSMGMQDGSRGAGAGLPPRRRSAGEVKDKYHLVPIDHGYCFPTALDIKEWDWAWFHLPHLKRPVHPKIKEYLLSLDFEKLCAELMEQVSISEESLFLLRLTHNLLVSGVTAGLNLYDIAKLIARLDEDEPSPLERAIAVGEENAHRAIEMRSGRLNSRGEPVARLSKGGRSSSSASARRLELERHSLARDPHNSDDALVSSLDPTVDRVESLAIGDRSSYQLPATPPLPASSSFNKSGSRDSLASAGSYGIGIADDSDSDDGMASPEVKPVRSWELDVDAVHGNSSSSGDLHYSKPSKASAPKLPVEASLPLPTPPLPPRSPRELGGALPITPLSMHNGASYGIGVGLDEGRTGASLAGGSLMRLESLQTPGSFKTWQTNATLSTASPKAKSKGYPPATPPPSGGLVFGSDTTPRSRFTQSGRDWLKQVGNIASPVASPANLTQSFEWNDGGAGEGEHSPEHKTMESLVLSTTAEGDDTDELSAAGNSALNSAYPSPVTDAASSGNFDSRSSSRSPRGGRTTSSSSSNIVKGANTDQRRISPKYRSRKGLATATTSGTTGGAGTDGDIDTDHEGVSPSDSNEEDEATEPKQNNNKPSLSPSPEGSLIPALPLGTGHTGSIKLMRVTSFTAFSNPPLYDTEESERRFGKLNREKRRLHVSTGEFKALRQHFTHERVAVLIGKVRSGSFNE